MVSIAEPCPLVNYELLQNNLGRKVRMVASIEDVQNGQATVKAADGGTVHVALSEPASFDTKFVMFEGIVESPNSMRVTAHTNFGNNFDMGNFNELCKMASGQFASLFK